MKKLFSLLIATALVLSNSFNIAFADEIEDTETTTTLDSSIFENIDYSYLGEECNETNIETDYNLYDELDYHDCEAVYDWIYETYNVSHSDEEANQFIWNNINKFVLLAIENEIVIYPQMSTFWFGNTHMKIFDKSVLALLRYSSNVYSFYKNGIDYDSLRDYTEEPDNTEKVPGTHYYVYEGTPSTYGNYYKNKDTSLIGNGINYSISARTRFEEHYFTAVNLYKNGYTEEGIKELGYALHYLQDIGCPPHAAGIKSVGSGATDNEKKKNKHWAYENYVNSDYLPNVYNASSYCYNSTIVNDVLNNDVGTNLNELARIAKNAYNGYKDVMTYASFKTAANTTMRKTQEYTTAYLIKFYNEVHSSSTVYVQDDCYYTLYNKYTNKYLSYSNNKFVWSNNKNPNCKFYIDIINNYYVIKTPTYLYFSIAFEGGNQDDLTYDILSTSTSNNLKTHFRIVPDKDNYYKILTNNNYTSSTENDCYKFYLCGTPDRIVSTEFDPDYTNFYWQIQTY